MMQQIVIPSDFRRPRFINDLWLNERTHWDAGDLTLLTAACSLGIHPQKVASTIGRSPHALIRKAMDQGIWVPREWRAMLPKRPKRLPYTKAPILEYPYIVKPDERHADLIAVSRMVSAELPGRDDVCQDIMLALWESRVSISELRSDPRAIRSFVRAFRKAAFERSGYGVESLDVTLYGDGEEGKSKYETESFNRALVDEDDSQIEELMFGDRSKGYSKNFSSHLINQISFEEETLGVPAAMWIRAEHFNSEVMN